MERWLEQVAQKSQLFCSIFAFGKDRAEKLTQSFREATEAHHTA
jgi:hypothetical protein